jgi:MFS family permease
MDRNEKLVVALTGCGHALTHAYLLIFPAVLLLLQKEFSVGFFELGRIATIMGLAYGLGALPGGIIYNRFGPKKLFLFCFLGSSIVCLLVALSPNVTLLTVGLALIGAIGSIFHPLANALITAKVREYGGALGIYGAVGNVGLAAAPFVAGLIGSYFGWRASYLCFAIPGILLSAWTLFVDMSPRPELKMDSPSGLSPKTSRGSFAIYLTLPLILIYLINLFAASCYQGALTFLPTFFAKRTSFQILSLDNVAIGGMLSAIVLSMGVLGQYIGGLFAQKRHLERNILLISIVSFPFILLMSFTQNVTLLVLALLYFPFNFFLQPMASTILAKATTIEMRGTAFGILFFLSFGLGSLSSGLSGYVAQNFGLQWVFLVLSGGAFLLVWTALFLLKIRKTS